MTQWQRVRIELPGQLKKFIYSWMQYKTDTKSNKDLAHAPDISSTISTEFQWNDLIKRDNEANWEKILCIQCSMFSIHNIKTKAPMFWERKNSNEYKMWHAWKYKYQCFENVFKWI